LHQEDNFSRYHPGNTTVTPRGVTWVLPFVTWSMVYSVCISLGTNWFFREEPLYLQRRPPYINVSPQVHCTVLREMVAGMPRWKCCTLVVSSGSTRRQCSHVELLKWGSYKLDIIQSFYIGVGRNHIFSWRTMPKQMIILAEIFGQFKFLNLWNVT
jgi:hypothetical protein